MKNEELALKILRCYPLIGDAACQIRAIYFLHLYESIIRNNDTSIQVENLQLIENSLVLTAIADHEYDPFKILTSEKSNLSKIPDDVVTKYGLKSKSKKTRYINEIRAKVAKTSADFLCQMFTEIYYNEEIKKYLTTTFLYLSLSGKHVPILPCYLSCKMMLDFLAMHDQLLTIKLTRIIQDHVEITPSFKQETFSFRFDNKTFVFCEGSGDAQLTITIDMYSCFNPLTKTATVTHPGFFAVAEFDKFFSEFKKADIAKLIILSASAHYQYPELTSGDTEQAACDFNEVKEDKTRTLTNTEFTFFKPSLIEYNQFRQLAQNIDLINFNHHDRQTKSPIIGISHIYHEFRK